MELYNNMINFKNDFFENMYKDLIHILKSKNNFENYEIENIFKKKYIFHDFETNNNNIDLFENLDLLIFNKIIKFLNNKTCKNINDFENLIKYDEELDMIYRKYKLTFGVCSLIDKHILNKEGHFWLKAYNNPIENQEVYLDGNYVGIAKDCGIFTFNII